MGRCCVYKIEFLSGHEGFTDFGQWEEQQEMEKKTGAQTVLPY